MLRISYALQVFAAQLCDQFPLFPVRQAARPRRPKNRVEDIVLVQ
jgi:hypothetical protein